MRLVAIIARHVTTTAVGFLILVFFSNCTTGVYIISPPSNVAVVLDLVCTINTKRVGVFTYKVAPVL